MKSQMRLKPFPVKPKKGGSPMFLPRPASGGRRQHPDHGEAHDGGGGPATPRSQPRTGNRPLMSCLAAISIMTAISGTAITPLSTAVQYSALIGLIPVKLIVIPTRVASATVP